jgi:hypothetical protein
MDPGWRSAHEAVLPRPPIPLDTIVARVEGNTLRRESWVRASFEGPFLSLRAKPKCEGPSTSRVSPPGAALKGWSESGGWRRRGERLTGSTW